MQIQGSLEFDEAEDDLFAPRSADLVEQKLPSVTEETEEKTKKEVPHLPDISLFDPVV